MTLSKKFALIAATPLLAALSGPASAGLFSDETAADICVNTTLYNQALQQKADNPEIKEVIIRSEQIDAAKESCTKSTGSDEFKSWTDNQEVRLRFN